MTARQWPAVTAVAWVAAQIAYPLTDGSARDRVTILIVALSAATALLHAWAARGIGWAAGYAAIVGGVGAVAEMIGTASGFPFGCYHYAHGRLGPDLAQVPLLVPVAWVGGLYPIWVATGLLCRRTVTRVVATAAGAVGWDLYLDPQMVADGQWTWCSAQPGLPGIRDIPYTNYLGWFAVGALMATLLVALERRCAPRGAGPAVPIAVLLWTWFGSALAHAVFLDLPASAGYGSLGLGLIAVPAVVWVLRAASDRARPLAPGHTGGPDSERPRFTGRSETGP